MMIMVVIIIMHMVMNMMMMVGMMMLMMMMGMMMMAISSVTFNDRNGYKTTMTTSIIALKMSMSATMAPVTTMITAV